MQTNLYRGKIKPSRQPTILEDGCQGRESSSIGSSGDSFRRSEHDYSRPSHIYAQSEMNVPVTTRDVLNTKRCSSTPDISISWNIKDDVPHSTNQQAPHSYADPSYTTRSDKFGIANNLPQRRSSPLQASVSKNLISSHPLASHTNGAINPSDGYALLLNGQYSSHPSSQQWHTSSSQYRPSQGTENGRHANSSSINSMPCSNISHILENERPQVSSEYYRNVLNSRRVAAWNNGEYSGPLAKSYWSFPNSSHQGIDADSVSPRSSRCERGLLEIAREGWEDPNGNRFSGSNHESPFAQGGESSYQTVYETNPARSNGYSNGLSAQQVDEDGENPQYMTGSNGMGNQEPLGASRTTIYTESTVSADSASSSSVCGDDGTCRRRLPSLLGHDLNTGINLHRSYQRYKEQKLLNDVGYEFSFPAQRLIDEIGNAFQCDVHVWQNGLQPNPELPDQLKYITLLFDTQCQGSNWVAAKIVKKLGAKVRHLPYQAEFIGFNGQQMTTSQQTTLSFKNSSGGSTWWADFLVSPVKKVPFDMLLGARDCLKFNIIRRPTLLGLAGTKQSKRT